MEPTLSWGTSSLKGERGSKANVVGVLAALALQCYLAQDDFIIDNDDYGDDSEANDRCDKVF